MSQIVTTPDGQRHIFPNEATPDQIKSAIARYSAQPPGPPQMSATSNPFSMYQANMKDRAIGLLPTAGGLVGGIAGAPFGGFAGAVGGAAAGGALGEGAREALSGEPISPLRVGGGGLEQGAYEALGQGLARGAGAVARPIMRRALGVGKRILSSFPDVTETVLSRGIPASAGGAAKAQALREASTRALDVLLANAKASGTSFDTRNVTQYATKLLRSKALPDKEAGQIVKQLVDFQAEQGRKIDPVLLKEIKQFYQARARKLYSASRAGIPTLAQENRGAFSKAIAKGAQEQLERIPGVARQEATTQSLMGAERAVKEAVQRPPRPFEVHKPGTYPIPLIMGSHAMSRYAIFLNSTLFKTVLRQSPRAAAAMLLDLGSAEPDATLQQ